MKKLFNIFLILFTLSQLALGSNIRAQKNFSEDQEKTLSGTSEITSISINPNFRKVYNLEVDVDHIYRVQSKSILVHNSYSPVCLNINSAQKMNARVKADGDTAIVDFRANRATSLSSDNINSMKSELKANGIKNIVVNTGEIVEPTGRLRNILQKKADSGSKYHGLNVWATGNPMNAFVLTGSL